MPRYSWEPETPSSSRAKAATLNPAWPETTDTWRAIESFRGMVHRMNTRSTIELNEPGATALLRACDDLINLVATFSKDASRYRWLREHPVFQVKELPNELELLDRCIDAYMTANKTER
jgi:hypothetical protein